MIPMPAVIHVSAVIFLLAVFVVPAALSVSGLFPRQGRCRAARAPCFPPCDGKTTVSSPVVYKAEPASVSGLGKLAPPMRSLMRFGQAGKAVRPCRNRLRPLVRSLEWTPGAMVTSERLSPRPPAVLGRRVRAPCQCVLSERLVRVPHQ